MAGQGSSRELRKFLAPEFVFGRGALALVGRYGVRLGAHRVLLVTDAGVKAAGWAGQVRAELEEAGLTVVEYGAVTANPRVQEVMAGAEVYREAGCDSLVACGGGSPIDCAKGIGVVVANGGEIGEYEGVDQVEMPMPPLLCVPTTAGTGADVSQFAILSEPAEQRKLALISKALVPDLALVDPGPLSTLDRFLRACTGVDALVHAIEAYVSTGHSPITDLHALEAIRLLWGNLGPSLEGGAAHDDAVALASLQAGLAFSNASLGLVHAMSHALGGLLDLPHGECNAILLDHVVEFNFEASPLRYLEVARAIGVEVEGRTPGEVRRELVEAIRQRKREVGIERSLREAGVSRGDVARLAENTLRDACIVTNPRQPCRRDIEVVYEQAF